MKSEMMKVDNGEFVATKINPLCLSGLKQARYVLSCLVNGWSEEKISIELGNDKQLITMWRLFLHHNHWIEKTESGWAITAKGKCYARI